MSPRPAEEVIAYLVETVAAQSRPAPNILGAEWQAANAVVWAFEDIGVIDGRDAERWKRVLGAHAERLGDMRDEDTHRLAGPPPPPPASQSTREKAAAYLREVEEHLTMTRGGAYLADRPELMSWLRGQSTGVVDGLYNVGLLYDAERLRWLGRLEAAMSLTGPEPRVELPPVHAVASPPQVVTTRPAEHRDPRAQPLRRPPEASLSVLVEILGVRADWTRGCDVYAIERWEDATIICWTAALDPTDFASMAQPRIDLVDDLGTQYQFMGGGAGTVGAAVVMGRLLIVPGIPPTASRLTVVVENEAADITLDPLP